ncbi:MAG TPA: hypothetical protein VIK50_10955 [Gemmatimonadaceae bacterium]
MRFGGLRRHVILGTVLAISVIAGTGTWLTRLATASRERELLRHAGVGLAFADSLEKSLANRQPAAISRSEAVAALYLERLRLGLGSPFRLIDQVLRDPAVHPVGADALAEAMLARTMMGDAYRPRPAALDLIYFRADRGLGARHQAIIDSVVSASTDPRIGELSIRLAYRLASASGAVSRRAPEIATAAAAQARDRILSMRDARALFTAADRDKVRRVTLLRVWHESRRFEVERPVIVPLTARDEREAVENLPALVTRIEGVAAEAQPFEETARNVYGQNAERLRGDAVPSRMVAMATTRDQPPLAPIIVAVRGYSGLLRNSEGSADRMSRLRFVERSSNEETLAAEYALLMARTRRAVPEADAAILTAGVALRPFAQEKAWLQGDDAPTVRDLSVRFGVAVTYDATTHAGWRPFFQRTLELAILDMKRVLPGFDPRGLRVHFGVSPLGDRALALHDPIRRAIYFPPTSHSGVMAHEFAHDLDWQAARRAYGGTGWYRTDHAVRQSVDQLAGALRQMASATRNDSASAPMMGVARPTEVLARNVDWFVSASLAREGRVNGHLSAAQDPVLTGYASAITPEAARDGGSATLRALDGLTSIPSATRSWFSELYGAERRLTVHEAVRRVLEAPLGRLNLSRKSGFKPWDPATFDQGFGGASTGGSWACLVEGFAGSSDDVATVLAIVQYAAESRARGVVRNWTEFARLRPHVSPPRLRALTGAPWDPAIAESTFREIRDAILWSALTGRWEMGDGRWGTNHAGPSGC